METCLCIGFNYFRERECDSRIERFVDIVAKRDFKKKIVNRNNKNSKPRLGPVDPAAEFNAV